MPVSNTRRSPLRHGDLVRVRSAREILATLDERGMLDGLPFMQEMIPYCGRQFVVDKRAEKICDTIYPLGSRRLPDTVLLSGLRCDGSGHDGCQADCRLFWKEAWLRRVTPGAATAEIDDGDAARRLRELLATNSRLQIEVTGQVVTRYRCQNTELHRASQPLSTWDPRAYLRVFAAGNVSLGRFLRVLLRAAIEEPMRKLRITPRVWVRGSVTRSSRQPGLDLQAGDLVRVKSKEEIIATLDPEGKTRGLFFDREMLPFCGGTYRVKQRVSHFIDEHRDGEMVELRTDCVTLDSVVCSGELSAVRWFCCREIHPFWREIWLQRVEEQPSAAMLDAVRAPQSSSDMEHHAGSAQIADDTSEIGADSTTGG